MLLLTLLFLSNPKTIIFIVFVLVLFFGAKRIPELFKGVGQGVREFKDATNEPQRPNYQAPTQANQPYGQPNPNQYYGQPNQQQPGYNQQAPGQIPPAAPQAPYNPNGPTT